MEIETEKPVLSINMYDDPTVMSEDPAFTNLSFSYLWSIAENRLKLLKRIQRFFEKRKEDEVRENSFYEGLHETLFSHGENQFLFNKRDDLASHWLLKLAFSSQDKDDFFFVFYEKILFAARINYDFYSKRYLKNHEKEIEEEKNNERLFDQLCDYIGVDPFETMTTEVFETRKREKKLEYIKKTKRYVMIPFRFIE